ncbi:MAG: hypothetical protein H8E79_08670 [Desulfobulbaceae bacterium]|uniref:Mannose-1-phosphate guanyltransferase C-terminal domain-containing protein n=1 Tax=Candidatus Desulfatifera sulfidica TaxID=2841691 RepID=A0A8J6N973_9BACT|nr:hypothetical protein [Candidatus Desulfatifera sulfidica]
MLNTSSLFDLNGFAHADLFPADQPAWTALHQLTEYMESVTYPRLDPGLIPDAAPLPKTIVLHQEQWLTADELRIEYGDATKGKLRVWDREKELTGASVIMAGTVLMGGRIQLGQGVLIESGALIKGPTIIGHYNEVRQGAYLRGYCLTGQGCVIGHTTEVKHSIFLDGAKAGHFAYLGDSILGRDVNLGAGTKFANLRFLAGTVPIRTSDGPIDSGRRKLGAILGDLTQTGCNSVTNPGTVMGKNCLLMPNTTAPSGYHPPRSIIR